MENIDTKNCKMGHMITYSFGECANSLVMNSLFGFAMLYYTSALGLKSSLAGLALSIAIFWDAITDPVMGHISDNTRSRFGRRHPYLLLGGLAMALSFYFLWYVPDAFKSNTQILFWYLLTVNLILRAAFTAFMIPYTALGFEMCTDYNGRTKLQGVRYGLNMAANFCGPALAWAIFFNNNEKVRATSVSSNYVNMGTVFSLATLVFVLIVVFVTTRYMQDSRQMKLKGNNLKAFIENLKEIVNDQYPRWAFAYIFIVVVGVALVSGLQMFLYEDFMKFTGTQKSIAHGGTMVGMGIGALAASILTKRFDKKGAIYLGGCWSIFCNVILAVLFLPGILRPGQSFVLAGLNIPIAFIIFAFFHGAYWFGNGIMFPVATSMMADVAEIHEIKTGINKDGGYAAVFSFAFKCAISVGTFVMGYCLTFIGFKSGTEVVQDQTTIWRLCAVSLLIGPVISLIGLALISKYPINKAFLEKLRMEMQTSSKNFVLSSEK